jgi:nitroreductase
MIKKQAITDLPINDLSKNRWSPRAFDPNRPVSHNQLLTLAEAARWTQSCYNEQPWRFIICDRNTDIEAYNKLLGCLVEFNQAWASNAPVLIAVISYTKFSMNGDYNRWSQYDCGAAAASLCYEAVHQGLVAHQMGGFDEKKLAKEFDLPPDHIPMAVIAVGYQGELADLKEQFHESELAERKRRPLQEDFFLSSWGNGIK